MSNFHLGFVIFQNSFELYTTNLTNPTKLIKTMTSTKIHQSVLSLENATSFDMAHFFVVYYFGFVVSTYVLNHFRGHWLLNDTQNFVIFKMKLKLKIFFDNGWRGKCCSWVSMFGFQHEKGSSWGFGFLVFLFKETWKNKSS